MAVNELSIVQFSCGLQCKVPTKRRIMCACDCNFLKSLSVAHSPVRHSYTKSKTQYLYVGLHA